ncbi:peptidoglycan/xylan/chitin deacetylase (PgdA/CDA1 family) [Amycolatopsis bartoniae]|uniref:Xylanase n=1 Tax=Amycolatopsis bartoniae TaxID=941986 RepID=A0A8H9MB88_9PSEU|nr:polysaccharide deacetylase family protein [Amycolatopsis bartoniae]MBB2938239.1 peptidoglycan/xylan/chitin deacetylase (PgdA/CDA1 family) [Amycolatopsis bartoniae]TVT09017.1 polysaccharide deacetylase family protein [Amycolatopsis bartoniae]GHF33704.1 xylanase [Amycolatopsis bartoniae]
MKIKLVPLAALLVLLAACSGGRSTTLPEQDWSSFAPLRAAGTTAPSPSVPPPAAVAANELGLVPVLMYHRIVDPPKSVYDRSPADFRAELERLARENYVPVTAAEFTAGTIDIPAGTHPVVLTFDDGDPSQFALDAAGNPVSTTAVGILLDVAREHPAFRPVATLYVNQTPFGDPGGHKTLPWLQAHGFDVGNHTLTHANLKQDSADEVTTEIAGNDREIRAAGPGLAPVTIALPFGVHPRQEDQALKGPGYDYRGAFLVGSNPSPSPYAAKFDPLNIPRIRSEAATGEEAEYGSTVWLDKLAADPGSRYTSDGDPAHVSYPKSANGKVAPAYLSRVNPY